MCVCEPRCRLLSPSLAQFRSPSYCSIIEHLHLRPAHHRGGRRCSRRFRHRRRRLPRARRCGIQPRLGAQPRRPGCAPSRRGSTAQPAASPSNRPPAPRARPSFSNRALNCSCARSRTAGPARAAASGRSRAAVLAPALRRAPTRGPTPRCACVHARHKKQRSPAHARVATSEAQAARLLLTGFLLSTRSCARVRRSSGASPSGSASKSARPIQCAARCPDSRYMPCSCP